MTCRVSDRQWKVSRTGRHAWSLSGLALPDIYEKQLFAVVPQLTANIKHVPFSLDASKLHNSFRQMEIFYLSLVFSLSEVQTVAVHKAGDQR